MERNTVKQISFKPATLISSPAQLLRFPYPSPALSINPSPLRKEIMAPPASSRSVVHRDPFFYTPRQLAEHLLLTYPPDYKVSPTQLKHSIILGNDVSGKVFLSAIPGLNDLESMLGVGTLGARVWLWDEVMNMRRVSRGYFDWKKGNERLSEKIHPEPSTAGVKRSRATERSSMWKEEPHAKRQARWIAVKATPVSIESGDTTSSSSETSGFKRREEEELSFVRDSQSSIVTDTAISSSAAGSAIDSSTMRSATDSPVSIAATAETEISSREATSSSWDTDFQQDEAPKSSRLLPRPGEKGSMRRNGNHVNKLAKRSLRPRAHNMQHLVKSELLGILDPEVLDASQITIMLYAIREISETDLYEEFIRAAKVTAREEGLPPSMLAIEEDSVVLEIVHEMAAVYSSWVLSKPYPLKSLNSKDVEKIADFDLFLQFKVQFLNLLIPYEKRRRSSSYHALNGRYRTPTPTPTPITIPRASTSSKKSWTRPTRRPELGLVTSDLPSSMVSQGTDRCPETGYTSKQRKWGEAVVRISGGAHKMRSGVRPHRGPTNVRPGPGNSQDPQAVPWGVDYLQGCLTPEGLQAFIDWATAKGKSNLLLWKYLNPKAYAEFGEKISNMESQLAEGIAKLEEFEANTW